MEEGLGSYEKKKIRCLAVAELGLKLCGELQGHKGRTD